MKKSQRERYVRWQEYRMTQLSFAINLFIGFAVASIAYVIEMKLELKPHGSIPLETVIILFGSSAYLVLLRPYRNFWTIDSQQRKLKPKATLTHSWLSTVAR